MSEDPSSLLSGLPDAVPREERDTLALAVCYARALAAAGQPNAALIAVRAAQARVASEFGPELPWRTALLAAYADAEARVCDLGDP